MCSGLAFHQAFNNLYNSSELHHDSSGAFFLRVRFFAHFALRVPQKTEEVTFFLTQGRSWRSAPLTYNAGTNPQQV